MKIMKEKKQHKIVSAKLRKTPFSFCISIHNFQIISPAPVLLQEWMIPTSSLLGTRSILLWIVRMATIPTFWVECLRHKWWRLLLHPSRRPRQHRLWMHAKMVILKAMFRLTQFSRFRCSLNLIITPSPSLHAIEIKPSGFFDPPWD